MLGYVKAYKPNLKMREFEAYRGVYCSLCRNLGRRYSPLAQLFLSFDFTLAALLTLALRKEQCHFAPCRCPYNAAKKCFKCTEPELLNSCADAVIITVYYKVLDNLHDKGIKSRLLAALIFPAISLMHRKAAHLSPHTEQCVASATSSQKQAEEQADCSIDKAADSSATALAEVFSFGFEGDEKLILSCIGYMTGRFVYILDAADDLESDTKSGNFNPFRGYISDFNDQKQGEEFVIKIKQMLNLTQHEATAALELLETKRFGGILRNIIYDGLDYSADSVLLKYTSGGKRKNKRRELIY